jgi:hypothetical protein
VATGRDDEGDGLRDRRNERLGEMGREAAELLRTRRALVGRDALMGGADHSVGVEERRDGLDGDEEDLKQQAVERGHRDDRAASSRSV